MDSGTETGDTFSFLFGTWASLDMFVDSLLELYGAVRLKRAFAKDCSDNFQKHSEISGRLEHCRHDHRDVPYPHLHMVPGPWKAPALPRSA